MSQASRGPTLASICEYATTGTSSQAGLAARLPALEMLPKISQMCPAIMKSSQCARGGHTHTHTHTDRDSTHSCNPPSGQIRVAWYSVFPTQRSRILRGFWLRLLSFHGQSSCTSGTDLQVRFPVHLTQSFVGASCVRISRAPCMKVYE